MLVNQGSEFFVSALVDFPKLHRFHLTVKALKWSFRSKDVIAYIVTLFASLLASIYAGSFFGKIYGEFYSSLENGDKDLFTSVLIRGTIMLSSTALLSSFSSYLSDVVSLICRRNLVSNLHLEYFKSNKLYYLLNFGDPTSPIDNPDQRITEECTKFSANLSQILEGCLTAPVLIGYYWVLSVQKTSWWAPLLVAGYYMLSYIVTKLLVDPVSKRVAAQEKLEGAFRYTHVHILDYAEEVALLQGSDWERQKAETLFRDLLETQKSVILWRWALNTASNIFSNAGSVVNFLALGLPLLLHGVKTPITTISEASFYLLYVVNGFSKLTTTAPTLATWLGYGKRIGELIYTLERLQNHEDTATIHSKAIQSVLKVENLEWSSRRAKSLTPLSFTLHPGESVLIKGPSGVGKTFVFRVLSGLWPHFSGNFSMPSKPLFMPQRCYAPSNSSLQEILTYPSISTNGESSSHLAELLSEVGLEKLILELFDKKPFEFAKLSPGEQQRLCWVRLMFHKPCIVFLDESTAHLDNDIERRLYQRLLELGTTFISIGHRDSIREHHMYCLDIN